MYIVDLSILGKDFSVIRKNDFFLTYTEKIDGSKHLENDQTLYFSNEHQGIDFIFNNNILTSIHFYGLDHENYNYFKGIFPFDININDTMKQVIQKFDSYEIDRGGGEVLPFIGVANQWIKFLIDEFVFRFEFKNEEIILITLSKSSL